MTLSAEQKKERENSIGSTDSPAILGYYNPAYAHMAKMKNASDVALRIIHDIEHPQSSVLDRGVKVEPKLLALFNEHVMPCVKHGKTVRHFEHQWMVASPDGDCGPAALVLPEFKTVGRWSWDKWGTPTDPPNDLVPDAYGIQVQHLMCVTDLPQAYVLAAFGTDFKDDKGEPDFDVDRTALYIVKRDQDLIDEIVRCGQRFMEQFVVPKILPDMKPVKNIRKWSSLKQRAVLDGVAND